MSDRTIATVATIFSVLFIIATLFGCWSRADAVIEYMQENRV